MNNKSNRKNSTNLLTVSSSTTTSLPSPSLPVPAPRGGGGGGGVLSNQLLARRHCNDSVVICGSDSDILLQAITLCAKIPNIAVLQVGYQH